MYIYNVTVNLESSIASDWLVWMRLKHIPDVMSTGCFISHRLCKVLADDQGETYSVQYFFNEIKDLELYQSNFAPALQAEHKAKYSDKALAFRTILQVID
ncbi:MAG: DUF4286 family protein [Bacteroidota bacterium]|jgi:hypothetical protein